MCSGYLQSSVRPKHVCRRPTSRATRRFAAFANAFGALTLSLGFGAASWAQCPFNVSGASAATVAVDGLVLTRAALEMRDAALTSRSSALLGADAIVTAIAANEARLDVNGSGAFDSDDAAIITRYLAGFRGDALIGAGAGKGATRKSGNDIQAFINGGCAASSSTRKKLSVMKAEQMPQNNGGVFISVLDDVEIDQSIDLTWLEVQGSLACTDQNLTLSAGWIMVHGGVLQCGTSLNPFNKKLTITLKGAKSDEVALGAGMGTKLIGAMHGGRIRLFGENRVSWTQLDATANAGSAQITLKDAVDWRAGERIVIASTAFDPDQAEERIIASVSGDGKTVTLTQALSYLHYGQLQSFANKTLDSRAEVALLSRNIVIEGEEVVSTRDQFGGHVMIMGSSSTARETDPVRRSSARIQGVEFRFMGQFDRLGRYPIHWHLNGDSRGDFVRGSSFHSNFQRGVVVHGTDNTVVERNVVHRSIGHSYSSEDGSETGNLFSSNLGLQTQAFPREATNPLQAAQNDTQAATYWIRGANNRFIGNHAAGGDHTAFWFDNVGRVDQSKIEFRSNVAHSYLIDGNKQGDLCCSFEKSALWFTGIGYDTPYRGPFPVSQMTIYKSRTAMWGNPLTVGQGFADVRLSDSIIADNLMGINSHGAKDTVIVGRSANPDTVSGLGSQGVQEYGHSLRLENVTFVNFPGGGALAHRNCHREAGNVTAINTSFINSKINLCASAGQQTSDMAIADTTGSILANNVPVTITPSNNGSRAMYIANDCPINASLGARVCNGLLRYSNLHMRGTTANLLRDDGVTLNSIDVNSYPFYWTTIEGRRYSLVGDVSSQPALEFTMFGKYEDDDADRSTIVRIPATSNFSIVGLNANWFSEWNATRNGMTAVPQRASLSALESSPETAYFYDGAARVIHLKIWTIGLNRVYIDRR